LYIVIVRKVREGEREERRKESLQMMSVLGMVEDRQLIIATSVCAITR
jgi:hypothetical protein